MYVKSNNVLLEFVLRLAKAKDKMGDIKFRLSNQRDYLEQLKNMQVKILC
jgi:hypothetical protein